MLEKERKIKSRLEIRKFSTLKSLYGHQRVHTREKQLERQLEMMKQSYYPGEGTSNSVDLGGFSQNDKYHLLSRDPIESKSLKNTTTFPSLNSAVTKDNMPVCRHPVAPGRNTSYGFSSGTPLVTHNHNHPTLSNFNRLGGVSFGPFKSGGGGSSRDYPIIRAPHRSLTQNTNYGSSSRVPLPSYRYNNSHDHPLGSANSIGRFSNNNNGSSQGSLSLELSLGPSKSMGDSNNNSFSQGSLSPELSLGPKSMGDSNNNSSSAYPSLITGGETRNMNMPVRPRASRFHFHGRNPLDSITRNVPLSHPPPATNMNMPVRPRVSRFHFHGPNPLDSITRNVPLSLRPRVSRFHFHSHNPLDSITRNVPLSHPPSATNMNMPVRPRVSRFHFHSRNPLNSIIRNVPLSHPPTTTNLPDDNNVSGSSLIAKEEDKGVVLDDDEKDNVVIGDHEEDQQEEVDAKSCVIDLSSSP
ncbi:hypothetical protein Bca52824_022127 [Brassica carinata]|uniref:Uncharacterized protein n=1 Tax=Brassica carinata TaxID=52824 RepID=A0A8X8ARC4_BRACI|nr:hypothetical protein Bca52824_022127 [Brassica carinata]